MGIWENIWFLLLNNDIFCPIIYGSETWVLTVPIIVALEGAYTEILKRLTGMKPIMGKGGKWEYPHSLDVLRTLGMNMVKTTTNMR